MNRILRSALFHLPLVWILAGCTFPAPAPGNDQAAVETEAPAPTHIPRPAAPTEPTILPTSQPAIAVVGPEEIIFDWTFDACEPEDIPDLPARAFRDAGGLIHLISSHLEGRSAIGSGLDDLVRDCTVISRSDHDGDPAMHNDNEWIAAVYTEDGQTIYATIHNEYHGWEHGRCDAAAADFTCWYNTLTLAVSTDGGRQFGDAAPPPGHFIAGLPFPYESGAGPYGIFEPSNILKAKDGYYYQVVRIDDIRSPEQWVCLIRTDDLADPSAWRAWDGAGFNTTFRDPYKAAEADPSAPVCAPLAHDQLGVMNQSLTYNSTLDRYVLLGLSADHIDGREVWGIYYSFSEDLLNWSHRRLLWERELPWTWEPGDAQPLLYPTLLDPASPSMSFDTTGQTAYLYFTIFNPGGNLDRDLVRVPVAFYESEAEAHAADTRTNLALESVGTTGEDLQVTGALTTVRGDPLPGQPIDFFFTPEEGPGAYIRYTVSGQIPADAARVILGFRVHMECECVDEPSEFYIYDVDFNIGGQGENLVPNPDFNQGLPTAAIWEGADLVSLEPSDRGEGQMVRIAVGAGQRAAGELAVIDVTGGETFSAGFGARVPPASAGTGIFVVIFVSDQGELVRYPLYIGPRPVKIGTAETSAAGVFSATLPAPEFGGLLETVFPGDGVHLPASGEAVFVPEE